MKTKTTKIIMVVDEATKNDEFVKTCRSASRLCTKRANITFDQILFSAFDQFPEYNKTCNYLFIIPYNIELIPSIVFVPYIKQRFENAMITYIVPFNSKEYINKLIKYEVDNVFIKPTNVTLATKSLEILIDNFIDKSDSEYSDQVIIDKREQFDRLSTKNLKRDINTLLKNMYFRRNYKGYNFTIYAIIECINAMNLGETVYMTKDVYPRVARKFGTTSANVEHAIRMYAHKIFNDPNYFTTEYFIKPFELSYNLTNSEFLNLIADGFIDGWIYPLIGKDNIDKAI